LPNHAVAAAAIAAALVSSQAATAQGILNTVHAYEGPHRPAAQLATVYGVRRISPLGRTLVCEVDGKSVRGLVGTGCRSIVYLLPGSHRLQTFYSSTGFQAGYGTITASFAAGRVYQIESDPVRNNRVAFRLRAMPPGFVLTNKDVLPDNPFLSTTLGKSRVDPAAK
jgi:hypothetical protein